MSKIGDFFSSSRRILSISQKPGKKEFWMMCKVIGLGILIIGVIGFIVRLVANLISGV